MKVIGIIAAMEEEFEEIVNIMSEVKEKEISKLTFITGKINTKSVVLVKSGIGKVNAARVTQIMIDNFHIETIINVGSAGALNPLLNIGDIVIGEKLIQHDFDITGVGDYISSDSQLIEKIKNSINNISNEEYKIKVGIIASGDIFCTAVEMKDKIYAKFNADCVEMEGAAIAQVCYLDKIPFIIIRSISDSPNGKNAIVFDEFVKLAAKRCSDILLEFFK